MKYNYCFHLQYDGSRYNGWQKQGNTERTIQGMLEQLLSQYTKAAVELKGSGRTDAGVHAKCQVANFYSDKQIAIKECKEWLNEQLPDDIRIDKAEEVSLAFHSRKSAIQKTYEYRIWNSQGKNVFGYRYAYSVEKLLNIKKMEEAAAILCGTHDFLGFSSLKESKKSTVRTIESISIFRIDNQVVIQYTGDGFLYHMVRILTGTLLEVGEGIREPDSIKQIFEKRERAMAGPMVPAHGLMLVKVEYS